MGKQASAAAIEPKDTYFVAATNTPKIANSITAPTGVMDTNSLPTAVAMPLPPRKRKKGLKMWPHTQPKKDSAIKMFMKFAELME